MIDICVPYEPYGSALQPVECEEIRYLRRETGQKSLICHKNDWGEWTISVKLPNGMYVDVAGAGSGERPEPTHGIIATIKSMTEAGKQGVLHKRIAKERELREKRRRKRLNETNYEYAELLSKFRQAVPGAGKDHPLLKDHAAKPGIIVP